MTDEQKTVDLVLEGGGVKGTALLGAVLDDLRRRLFLSGPGGEGRAAVDGSGREPEGHRRSSAGRNMPSAITGNKQELPLLPDKLVYAFSRWDEQIGSQKEEVTTGKSRSRAGDRVAGLRACPGVVGDRSNPSIMAIAARDFRELRLDGMSRNFGSVNALKGVNLDGAARRVHRAARPVRLRQIDGAELPRRPADAVRRQHLARQHPHRPAQAGRARLRHGVPELRAVPAYERAARISASA